MRGWPQVLLCVALLAGCSPGEPEPTRTHGRPLEGESQGEDAGSAGVLPAFRSTASPAESGFADNEACAGCHRAEFEAWMGSDHQLAMQVADETSILGDFDDASITIDGVTSRFFRRDGRFWVNTAGADGVHADYPIAYVFGVRPLQQYLVAMPGGRLQCLVATWDDVEKRWYDLYPDETIKPGDPYHWTGRYQNWNLMCAECHSTDLRENYDLNEDTYATTWAEINVSCQACHGPGHEHVQWAQTHEERPQESAGDRRLLVNYAAGDGAYQVETCARCHSRRRRVSGEDAHGRPFLDDFMPALLRQGLYHPDGQILEEVYVYGSFVQSPMYREGVRCSDCHDPHSLELVAEGNGVCTSCHQQAPDSRFSTLQAAVYDDPQHHHHGEGSPGAQCVACHMPATTYMGVDPRRDHSMRVPRPDLAAKLGTPDACTGCHQDETSSWAANVVEGWFPGSEHRGPHFGEILARGHSGDGRAGPELALLAQDEEQSAMVRATALDLLGSHPEGQPVLLEALQDPDPMVRAAAVQGLESLPPQERLTHLVPLLDDPVRAVRVEAARLVAVVLPADLDPEQTRALEAPLGELMESLIADSDTPAAHVNMGSLAAARGKTGLAEAAFLKALEMDPGLLSARFNLARLYGATGLDAEAEATLREGIAVTPHEGELYYALGLILAEGRHFQEAAGALGSAVELMPDRPQVHYSYALVVQQLGDVETAEAALLKAYDLDHDDVGVVHALGLFYAGQQLWERARPFADRLIYLAPGDKRTEDLVARVRRGLRLDVAD